MNITIRDDVFAAEMVREAAASWPGPEAPWVRYDTPLERKQTLNDWPAVPLACAALLRHLLSLPVGPMLGLPESPPLLPDMGLWGAGLHEHQAGQHLDVHLDADCHRLTGMERRANAILFLSPWRAEWGGPLELWDHDLASPILVYPAPGRLVLFECSDGSYHGVPRRVTGPQPRRSLAVYWWSLPRGPLRRPRARYVALPGEEPSADKELLRQERGR